METQLIIKIIHMCGVALGCAAIFIRAFTLFKGTQGNLPNPAGRKFFVALQHGSMTLIAVYCFWRYCLLYLKRIRKMTVFYWFSAVRAYLLQLLHLFSSLHWL